METSSMPQFELRDAEGRETGTEGLWQQQEMIVAVTHGEGCEVCRAAAQAYRAGAADWSGQNVGLVFVDAQHPIAEEIFEHVAPLGVQRGVPCVAIADRYGQLYAALDVHAMTTDALIAETRSWIDYIQEVCDECGAPLDWDG